MQRPRREVRVALNAAARGVTARAVRRAVLAVLDGERAGPSVVSVTFVSPRRIRALKPAARGGNALTDVVAFELPHPDALVGDVYVCSVVARSAAGALGIPLREELLRLVIHGTLHVLGYEHPEGPARQQSPMWRRQERYVRSQLPTGR